MSFKSDITATPRIVLFTTLTIGGRQGAVDTDAPQAEYDLRDQYMPYFLAEDPTMPPVRARALLQEWSSNRPWDHYLDNSMSAAVRKLASTRKLGDKQVSGQVKILRKHVSLDQHQRLFHQHHRAYFCL
jgi:hypothetical protein